MHYTYGHCTLYSIVQIHTAIQNNFKIPMELHFTFYKNLLEKLFFDNSSTLALNRLKLV